VCISLVILTYMYHDAQFRECTVFQVASSFLEFQLYVLIFVNKSLFCKRCKTSVLLLAY